jgi:hypothetical protein
MAEFIIKNRIYKQMIFIQATHSRNTLK